SSERQLRAYVHVEGTPTSFSNGVFEVKFSIKNFGQTPAHNVRVRFAFKAVRCKDDLSPDHEPIPDQDYSLGSIAPHTDFYELDPKVENVNLDSITNGAIAIYLVGMITYDTVFNPGCVTNFRYLVDKDTGWKAEDEMSADESGNAAT